MTTPYTFQSDASTVLIDRVAEYIRAPILTGRSGAQVKVPLLQLLDSITASGKTIILAQAVQGIALRSPLPPVVLWLSKMTVVVGQTFRSLSPGGQIHDLIAGFRVVELSTLKSEEFSETNKPVLVFATVGTFNRKEKDESTLRVFRQLEDVSNQSRWEMMRTRPDGDGTRRPLIVVYDEAHNLTDQQVDILLGLEPDAFLLATATQKLPKRLQSDVINKLLVNEYTSDELQLVVPASEVAKSGLVKDGVHITGQQAPTVAVVDDIVSHLDELGRLGAKHGLVGRPKAVYVTKTNVVEDTGEHEDHKQPFNLRNVPPIVIWRHLVEKLKVRPDDIAVYCDLKVDRKFPLPAEFKLFPGGTSSYNEFIKGDFTHIIFNLALQEGWDDPLVYAAYIDRSMGSKVQAEQVVGRLLRQPGRKLYSDPRLNKAHVFVRVEKAGVFDAVVGEINKKLKASGGIFKLTTTAPGKKERAPYEPKKELEIPRTTADSSAAGTEIDRALKKLHDYAADTSDTKGVGKIARVQRIVGQTDGSPIFEWEERGHTAKVTVRWLFREALMKRARGAFNASSVEDGKFDRRVGYGSTAAMHIEDVAEQVARAYVDHSLLKVNRAKPYVVGAIEQSDDGLQPYKHALHDGYSGLNDLELIFAAAIDGLDVDWCRNLPRVGYGIPVIAPGATDNFYPDFLIWQGGDVYCVDTKGPHLHADAERKMMQIRSDGNQPRVFVRFITQGAVDSNGPLPDKTGYTTWRFGAMGQTVFTHHDSMVDAIRYSLNPDL